MAKKPWENDEVISGPWDNDAVEGPTNVQPSYLQRVGEAFTGPIKESAGKIVGTLDRYSTAQKEFRSRPPAPETPASSMIARAGLTPAAPDPAVLGFKVGGQALRGLGYGTMGAAMTAVQPALAPMAQGYAQLPRPIRSLAGTIMPPLQAVNAAMDVGPSVAAPLGKATQAAETQFKKLPIGAQETLQALEGYSMVPLSEVAGLRTGVKAAVEAVPKTIRGVGTKAMETGVKIENIGVKILKREKERGAKVENLGKYDLFGSPEQVQQKAQSQIVSLAAELRDRLATANEDSALRINGGQLFARAAKKALTGTAFGRTKMQRAIEEALTDLGIMAKEEGIDLANIDLLTAQRLKQDAGAYGDWIELNGKMTADPDANMKSQFYNDLYRELKTEIENRGPAGIKEINKQISELIPLELAARKSAIVRGTKQGRNELIPLKEFIGMGASLATGTVAPLAIVGAQSLSKSPNVARWLYNVGRGLGGTLPQREAIPAMALKAQPPLPAARPVAPAAAPNVQPQPSQAAAALATAQNKRIALQNQMAQQSQQIIEGAKRFSAKELAEARQALYEQRFAALKAAPDPETQQATRLYYDQLIRAMDKVTPVRVTPQIESEKAKSEWMGSRLRTLGDLTGGVAPVAGAAAGGYMGWQGSEGRPVQERIAATLGGALMGAGVGQAMRAKGRGNTVRSIGTPVTETAPALYSNAQKAVSEINMPKAPASQWLSMLDPAKGKGTKADEMKWTGLDDFLKSKGDQSVSKQEIADYLKQNEVKLEEVHKGAVLDLDSIAAKTFGKPFSDLTENQQNLIRSQQIRKSGAEIRNDATKFSQYQLPGGKNYREVLVTLPVAEKPPLSFDEWIKENDYTDMLGSTPTMNETLRQQYSAYARQNEWAGKPSLLGRKDVFKSSHWDEPNVIAHYRLNDRTIDGKKTLFVEEIQSDWHQQGRQKGYSQVPVKKNYTVKEGKDEDGDQFFGVYDEDAGRFISSSTTRERAEQTLQESLQRSPTIVKGVPDAPFSKTWHELAFKKILREAAEKGYDKVAWTTGEQQAARYDLSKQLSEVRVRRDGPKDYTVVAVQNNGSPYEIGQVTEKQLPEYVGKDLAEKISNQSEPYHNYSGLDLKVGGEGMKGFYDKMVVDFAKKYGKKWGATVKQESIPTGKVPEFEKFAAQQRKAYPNLTEEQIRESYKNTAGVQPIWTMDITPAMRGEVMNKGQAMFALPIAGATIGTMSATQRSK